MTITTTIVRPSATEAQNLERILSDQSVGSSCVLDYTVTVTYDPGEAVFVGRALYAALAEEPTRDVEYENFGGA